MGVFYMGLLVSLSGNGAPLEVTFEHSGNGPRRMTQEKSCKVLEQ